MDRSAGGLEFRFAIRARMVVVQWFALGLRNGIGVCFESVRGSARARAFRFVIRSIAIVAQVFALELRNEVGGIWGGMKNRSRFWKPVGVVLKK